MSSMSAIPLFSQRLCQFTNKGVQACELGVWINPFINHDLRKPQTKLVLKHGNNNVTMVHIPTLGFLIMSQTSAPPSQAIATKGSLMISDDLVIDCISLQNSLRDSQLALLGYSIGVVEGYKRTNRKINKYKFVHKTILMLQIAWVNHLSSSGHCQFASTSIRPF